MATTGQEAMTVPVTSSDEQRTRLAEQLGGYRAEQLESEGRLYDLFTAPAFMADLRTDRNCMLVGGRGTGKTTILKSLSYQGQLALDPEASLGSLKFYGLYLKVNSNRVAAFAGSELDTDKWQRVFGHYVNLLLCDQLLELAQALEAESEVEIDSQVLDLVASSLHVDASSISHLRDQVRKLQVQLEAEVNNVGDRPPKNLSLQGQPVDLLASMLRGLVQLQGKPLFFMVDEYENLSSAQQESFNTLIKHAGPNYSFKVGIKSLGLKTRTTLADSEVLSYPADYELIDIVQRLETEGFAEFAAEVFRRRWMASGVTNESIEELLEDLSIDEEARRLGVESRVRDLRSKLIDHLSAEELERFDQLDPLDAYAITYMAFGADLLATAKQALIDSSKWRSRIDNYRYSMLFTIRRGKRGRRKLYSGWRTIAGLASGNTRYLLQLLNEITIEHLARGGQLGEIVSAEVQTDAAAAVGYRNLHDLEGIARDGASLTKLVLGVGRVFGVMAARPEGHAPEIVQFALSDAQGDPMTGRAVQLLDSGVQHQALVSFAGNKLALESGETRAENYALHPLFAPFFVYSHRKKRKTKFSPSDIVGFVESPATTIASVLGRSSRESFTDELLGEGQLSLFAEYYGLS